MRLDTILGNYDILLVLHGFPSKNLAYKREAGLIKRQGRGQIFPYPTYTFFYFYVILG